jgi:hypothetical protein
MKRILTKLYWLFHHRNLDASQPSGSRDPARAFAQLRLRSAHPVYCARRATVKTHLARNHQLLTRDPKGVPPQKARGPESVTTVHSQPHRQMRRLEPSPSRLRIFPLLSSLPSSHLSLRSLSHLSGKTFLFRSTLDIYIRACGTLHAMSNERAKGCWRGLNPDE